MQLRFGSQSVVVGSSAKIAKAFFKTHDVAIFGRPKLAAGKYTTYNYSNITWPQYGPYWKQACKLCMTELLSAKRLDSYEYIRKQELAAEQELRAFLNDLFVNTNEPIELKHHFNTLTLNIISRMVFGKKYLENSENAIVSPEEVTKMLDKLFVLNGVLNIRDFIPWINFLDLQGYIKKMKMLGKKFDRFIERVLDEHIERRKAGRIMVPKTWLVCFCRLLRI
ncbi:hypothetical protein PIB30_014772 [Stylosanthes scabra]|uniref:Cytochrome P450 n=1 Tax=Stylosanthes scabra TaxID=79078 RepID=A0ABU6Y708_9FABA|nr:hypothetical protein [Stylosanthes scabra]